MSESDSSLLFLGVLRCYPQYANSSLNPLVEAVTVFIQAFLSPYPGFCSHGTTCAPSKLFWGQSRTSWGFLLTIWELQPHGCSNARGTWSILRWLSRGRIVKAWAFVMLLRLPEYLLLIWPILSSTGLSFKHCLIGDFTDLLENARMTGWIIKEQFIFFENYQDMPFKINPSKVPKPDLPCVSQ